MRKRIGMQKKLVLNYSILLLVILAILIVAAYRYVLSVSEKSAEINQQQLAEKTLSQMDSYLKEMEQMAVVVSSDNQIINLFSSLQNKSKDYNYFEMNIMEEIDVSTLLASLHGPSAPFWRISVYNHRGDFVSTGAVPQVDSLHDKGTQPLFFPIETMMEKLLENKEGYLILPAQKDHWSHMYGEATFTSFLYPITDYYKKQVYGIVEIQQNTEELEQAIAMDVLQDLKVFVFDSHGNQVLPRDESYHDTIGRQHKVTAVTSSDYGWSVSLAQSRKEMIAPYQSFLWYLLGVGLAVMVFLLLIVYAMSKRISEPIEELSEKVRTMTISQIPETIEVKGGTEEVKELKKAFEYMLQRMRDSIAVEQNSYLLALQSQMNPHFLFNTLSVVSSIALEERTDDVVEACTKLSSMLRYSASYTAESPTLAEEIDNVENYLHLMKLRFEEQFRYEIKINPRLLSMPMPRLVLQPLVENCFEHGFQGVKPPWILQITGELLNGQWILKIKDNGKGMPEEEIQALIDKVEDYSQDLSEKYQEMKIGGLGLANTILRLKLTSKEEISFAIESTPGKGTTILLKGVYHDSGIDSGR